MTARRRGMFLAIEGIDGVGKSTLLRSLASALRRRGLSVAVRREPADRRLGALAQSAAAEDPWTGAVYFTVDRHLAAPALERALREHDVVLQDRSYFSTLAYQGSALPAADRRRLAQLQRSATRSPDRVVLLDLLNKSKRPLLARELADLALAEGYPTKSKDFTTVVWVMLGKMENVENIPNQGYRLKKR